MNNKYDINNKTHKRQRNNNTIEDTPTYSKKQITTLDNNNQTHSYDYTYTLLNNDSILKFATHNVRSFNNPVKKQNIMDSVLNYNLDFFGICETNLTIKQTKYAFRTLNTDYDYYFSSDIHHNGSGVGIIIKNTLSSHVFNHFEYKGRVIYLDLQMKNNKKLRVFQIYLHTSNYDIKERMKTHAIIKEHINQARNRHYQIIIMGDFNVNPDKLRLNETKYK